MVWLALLAKMTALAVMRWVMMLPQGLISGNIWPRFIVFGGDTGGWTAVGAHLVFAVLGGGDIGEGGDFDGVGVSGGVDGLVSGVIGLAPLGSASAAAHWRVARLQLHTTVNDPEEVPTADQQPRSAVSLPRVETISPLGSRDRRSFYNAILSNF